MYHTNSVISKMYPQFVKWAGIKFGGDIKIGKFPETMDATKIYTESAFDEFLQYQELFTT